MKFEIHDDKEGVFAQVGEADKFPEIEVQLVERDRNCTLFKVVSTMNTSTKAVELLRGKLQQYFPGKAVSLEHFGDTKELWF